jgi:hypothetical protein
VWCETNAAGTIHFTWFAARGAKLVDKSAVGLKYLKTEKLPKVKFKLPKQRASLKSYLHSVIPRVCNNDVALVVDGHTLGSEELLCLWAFAAEEASCREVRFYNHKPVVVEVGDDDPVVGCPADTSGRVKVLPHASVVLKTVLAEEISTVVKELDSMVSRVRDDNSRLKTGKVRYSFDEITAMTVLRSLLRHPKGS